MPATKIGPRFVRPICSVHKTAEFMRRNDLGEWFCIECADLFLKRDYARRTRGKSVGGVELPIGVADERRPDPSFRDVVPNRAARRRLRKGK